MSASDTITTSGFERPRLLSKKVLAKTQNEGKGAVVRRSIGRNPVWDENPLDNDSTYVITVHGITLERKLVNNILPFDITVSPPAGFPNHPHRGFETVTYMLQGAFTHQDFGGHKGTVRTGDVQWMTAGRGIIHSEMPAWRRIEPRYQELLSEDVPKAEKDGVEVKIIAGETMGVHSPVCTQTPTMYLDFTLKPNAQYHQSIPESWNAFVYIIAGEGVFDSQNSAPIKAHHLLVLGPGEGLSVWNKSFEPLRFILVGGQPLNEPVVQHGPFVMNTQAEIDKTIEDYYYGKNGFEMARHWIPQ
ncbi:Pirin-like protein [Forsythia ovata]|uniref:Pirin-like protein n=1 Tax=Forsythia ovata TaxID=205694 RepID=A0ABD1UZG2_9LAMI